MKATPFVFSCVAAAALSISPLQAQTVSPSPGIFGAGSSSGVQPTLTPGIQHQTLGPWELTPPDSATLLSGGGGSTGWLNVVNGFISISDAMSSNPIESAGYANLDMGTQIEVTFAGGVTNGPGPDLVMLDAQFDWGLYTISSDYDGFVATTQVDALAGTLATVSTLYYELNPGPWTPNVLGMEVDLTNLGVPAGSSVNSLRFLCSNAACDPISLAKIGSSFTLEVSALAAGTTGTFTATGGTPSGSIGIGYSLAGNGPTFMNTGACGFMDVALTPPIGVLAILAADINGDIGYAVTVPAGASGLTAHFQALDFGSCTLSNGVTVVVL